MSRPHERVRHTVWRWLAVPVVIVLVAYALWSPAPKMPVYQGRTLSEWIVELDRAAELHPADFAKVAAAQAAIRAIGTNAMPIALANLYARITLADQAMAWLAKRAPFLKLRPKDVRAQRELGVQIVDILGPIALPCLPELIAGATNSPYYSEEALLAVGPAALPAFTNLLNTSQMPERKTLFKTLMQAILLGRVKVADATIAVPCLVELFHSTDRMLAQDAVLLIGVVHQRPDICVPVLIDGFSDPSSTMRRSCIQALNKFEAAGSVGADKLAAAFDNPDADVRLAVCINLYKLQTAKSVAAPVLLHALQDKDVDVRSYAATVLGRSAADAKDSIPALEKALQDSSSQVRCRAAMSLGRFGSQATNAIPSLEQSCSDADATVRAAAANSLKMIRE